MALLARPSARVAAGIGAIAALLPALAQDADTRAVPTYESVGIYWSNPGAGAPSGCEVRYRKVGATDWSLSTVLWFDARDGECRGSLVHLDPDTAYEAEIQATGTPASTRTVLFRTWSNRIPVLRTVLVPGGSATLNITEGGSALTGYVVYQGAPGAVLDAQDTAPFNVTVDAAYVAVRGLTLRGAQRDAIRLQPNARDVMIEDNDISGWGRQRLGNRGIDLDSAIRAVCTQPTLERVTIQRNRIHDPRYGANSWSEGHPQGPQAITFSHCGGNHVIRHNEIRGNAANRFNDAIGGEDNFTTGGFPNRDSDIYGNVISHAWDDGIEAEGANANVRVWGNYIDRTGIGVATTVTSRGPVYIFRNVWNRSQFHEAGGLDSDDRQPFFKSGSSAALGDGRRYVFHNTMLQAIQAGLAYPLGGGYGMGGTGAAQLVNNTTSMNNIYHLWKPNGAFYQSGSGDHFANDMYSGTTGDAAIVNGIHATPVYAPGHGWVSESGGLYQLAAGTPGHDQGERIAGFNDGFRGAAPDIGAHEGGSPAMRFGIAASPGAAVHALGAFPKTLDFGGQSMGTRSAPKRVTISNAGPAAVSFMSISASGPFRQANDCGSLAPGASCSIDVEFSPVPGPGDLNAATAQGGSLVIASDDPVSVPLGVDYAGIAEKSLVTHYYRSILRRAPDAGGKLFWAGEAARVAQLGANLNDVWFAMAGSFFYSREYEAFQRGDREYVADLYTAFLNRAADAGGLAHWSGQIASGLPREVMLSTFVFSTEFTAFTRTVFGDTAARAEIDLVVDFYRGLLARLPDTGGFSYWVTRLRTAQCLGAAAVHDQVAAMSSGLAHSPEYLARNRTTAQFVGDLYGAYLRRGGDLAGVRFWIDEIDTRSRGRDQVRESFQSSPEFSARVNAAIGQGCIPGN